MKGVNKAILMGTLGKDPDLRQMGSGGTVATCSVATNERWKDKHTGQMKESTEWHRVVVFGKQAEIVGQYLHKGSKAYFEGKIQTRKWQDNDGKDRYSTEIVVNEFGGTVQLLDPPPSRDEQPQQQPAPQGQSVTPGEGSGQYPAFDDDIPF